MTYFGWPCDCPQCIGGDDEEDEPSDLRPPSMTEAEVEMWAAWAESVVDQVGE